MRILIGLLAILIGIKVLKKVSKLIMILAILIGVYLCVSGSVSIGIASVLSMIGGALKKKSPGQFLQ